jgi:hypothetical protein
MSYVRIASKLFKQLQITLSSRSSYLELFELPSQVELENSILEEINYKDMVENSILKNTRE